MRTRLLFGAVVLAASFATPAQGAPPDPRSCNATLAGSHTPADPGGLTPTGSVVSAWGTVVCDRNVLTTPPAEYLVQWGGHITLNIVTDDEEYFCGHGPDIFPTVGATLQMAIEQHCVIPFNDPKRNKGMWARLDWATFNPYVCCGTLWVRIEPAGAGVY